MAAAMAVSATSTVCARSSRRCRMRARPCRALSTRSCRGRITTRARWPPGVAAAAWRTSRRSTGSPTLAGRLAATRSNGPRAAGTPRQPIAAARVPSFSRALRALTVTASASRSLRTTCAQGHRRDSATPMIPLPQPRSSARRTGRSRRRSAISSRSARVPVSMSSPLNSDCDNQSRRAPPAQGRTTRLCRRPCARNAAAEGAACAGGSTGAARSSVMGWVRPARRTRRWWC